MKADDGRRHDSLGKVKWRRPDHTKAVCGRTGWIVCRKGSLPKIQNIGSYKVKTRLLVIG